MSRRFNKSTPEDFGLIKSEIPDQFLLPLDKSLWIRRELYDFGQGKENGFCRLPIPNFNGLIDLVLKSELVDNRYGAAAVLLDDYPNELLDMSQRLFHDKSDLSQYKEFFRILHLDEPINRSEVIGKNIEEVNSDFQKWCEVASNVQKLLEPTKPEKFAALLNFKRNKTR